MTPKIQTMNLSELTPADYNPRKIDERALAGLEASIDRFGLVEPIVWNKRTGNVVGGHQRLKVLRSRDVETTDVVVVDMSDSDEKALNVALNNPHIAGEFTEDLQGLLRELEDVDADLYEALRFDELVIEDDEAIPVDNEDEPTVSLPTEPTAKPGDIWSLGDHRLMCGSCTDRSDVLKLILEDRAICMWTDPPYGVDYVGKTKEAKTIQNDGAGGLSMLLDQCFAIAFEEVLNPGSAIYVAHPAGKNSVQFYTSLMGAGFEMRQGLVWVKNTFALGHSDYHYRHEPIWYGCKPGGDGRFGRGGDGWYGDNAQDSVFEVNKPNASTEHPTMKPIELVARMLVNSTRKSDVVYEPFSGSGTTLLTCEKLGRRCLAMEIDPRYVDVAVTRWENETGKKATREE